jgi:hypothetical protein
MSGTENPPDLIAALARCWRQHKSTQRGNQEESELVCSISRVAVFPVTLGWFNHLRRCGGCSGKVLMEFVLETKASTIEEFVQGATGNSVADL